MDAAEKWGLPPGFQPVRYAICDAAKNAARAYLTPDDPVIISIGNEGDSVSIVATPKRVLTIKTSAMGAGAAGAAVKDFPWEGIFDIVKRPQSLNLTLAIHYRSSDGRRIEVGQRARIAKEAVESLLAFPTQAGDDVFKALLQVWNWKKAANSAG